MKKKPLFWIIDDNQFIKLSFMTNEQIEEALKELNNLPVNGGLYGSKVNSNQWKKYFNQEINNRERFINNLLDNCKFHVNSNLRNKFKRLFIL